MPGDLALQRGLPANLDCERFALGAILMDGSNYRSVAATLDPSSFSLEKHRRIFQRMGEINERGEPIDRATLANELMRQGQLESVGGVTYLVSLDEGLPELANLESYVAIVKEKYIKRLVIFDCQRRIQECLDGEESAGDLIQSGENFLKDLRGELPGQRKSRGFGEILESRGGLNSYTEPRTGVIRTPLLRLNRALTFGGLLPGQMITVAARTGEGKTALALQFGHYAAKNGNGTLCFSMEMPGEDVMDRVAAGKAQVDGSKLDALLPEERVRFAAAHSELADMPFWIDDTSRSILDCHASIRDRMKSSPVKLAIFDYLQIMEPPSHDGNSVEQITQISRGIKLFAMEYRIPVIALAQFSRKNSYEKRQPELSDLRGSGTIENDSDKVLFIWRPGEEQENRSRDIIEADLILAKQRNGSKGYLSMKYVQRFCQFTDSTAPEPY